MADNLGIRLQTVVLDCLDAHVLSNFYKELLGWEVRWTEPDWVLIRPPAGGTGLSFQAEAGYVPPVYPERPGEQQKMLHLDIRVDDLESSGKRALELGATLFAQRDEHLNVYLDPAGHPFCLFVQDDD